MKNMMLLFAAAMTDNFFALNVKELQKVLK